MLFPSPEFLFVFLPLVLLVTTGTWLFDRSKEGPGGLGATNAALLLASLFFYAWGEGPLLVLMLGSIAGNYACGLWVGAARERGGGKLAVACAVALNLSVLGFFKYANFAVWNAGRLLGSTIEWTEIPLPIGISFFTFQAMSYVIDVYRGEAPVQRRPIDFALYIALFPQLIAGPIVRYRDVATQLAHRVVSLNGFAYGVRRFIVGLGKKCLIANALGEVADRTFAIPGEELWPGLAWIGIAAYTLHIYYDFSGYSDMAIGLGRMFGFRFLENFRWPYIARSITEFWRRWHISLSSWFRDYLYIPLGGNRRGRLRTYLNLVIVFFLCGLWHGAAWNFVVWGLFHGAFLVLERAGLSSLLERTPRALRHAYVMLVAMVAWVFFRAEDLGASLEYLASMAFFTAGDPALHPVGLYFDHEATLVMVLGILGVAPVFRQLETWRTERAGRGLAWTLDAVALACLCLVFLGALSKVAVDAYSPFIYFRF